jgi:hypothetical protein
VANSLVSSHVIPVQYQGKLEGFVILCHPMSSLGNQGIYNSQVFVYPCSVEDIRGIDFLIHQTLVEYSSLGNGSKTGVPEAANLYEAKWNLHLGISNAPPVIANKSSLFSNPIPENFSRIRKQKLTKRPENFSPIPPRFFHLFFGVSTK